MAAKRGKSQARRNTGGKAGLPGWAWLALGVVLTVVVVFAAPKFFHGSGGDGFFRPKPNPDAQPAATVADDAIVPDDDAEILVRMDGGDARVRFVASGELVLTGPATSIATIETDA